MTLPPFRLAAASEEQKRINPGWIPGRPFVQELFNWLAPQYHSGLQSQSLGQDLRWKHVLVQRLAPQRGETALDLATGTGLILERLAGRVGEGSVVGLDRNRRMLALGRAGHPARRLALGDAEALPFRTAAFDLLTSGYLFKYVALDRFAREAARVLKPGGRFGGYDFSHPRRETAAGRLYAVYLSHVLPSMAGLHAEGREEWRRLARFFEQVTEGSRWEDRLPAVLQQSGFEEIRSEVSLGGAITWVWARRART